MLPDHVSNPGPLTYESGALPIALRDPADHGLNVKKKKRALIICHENYRYCICCCYFNFCNDVPLTPQWNVSVTAE